MHQGGRPGRIVFLNGVPNAGKTTLAALVQERLVDPYWHLSLDDFLHGFTDSHWRASNRPSFRQVMLGYLRSLRQLSLCGIDILAEAVLTPDRLPTYLELFGDLPVLLVGLHIPPEEAHRRERARSDRRSPYWVTERDVEWVHAHRLYDLELDTMRLSPEEAAGRIVELIASPPATPVFQRLRAERNP